MKRVFRFLCLVTMVAGLCLILYAARPRYQDGWVENDYGETVPHYAQVNMQTIYGWPGSLAIFGLTGLSVWGFLKTRVRR